MAGRADDDERMSDQRRQSEFLRDLARVRRELYCLS